MNFREAVRASEQIAGANFRAAAIYERAPDLFTGRMGSRLMPWTRVRAMGPWLPLHALVGVDAERAWIFSVTLFANGDWEHVELLDSWTLGDVHIVDGDGPGWVRIIVPDAPSAEAITMPENKLGQPLTELL